MKKGFLIYHPRRVETNVGNLVVHHDKFGSNEDPYIWNDKFLHSFCHITQLPNDEGQINFWISGDHYPNFTKLFCDCVFVVEEKIYWRRANLITRRSHFVKNDQREAFDHHYKWVNPPHCQHVFKRRRRYTLKAHRTKSFQPQGSNGRLIDIMPVLRNLGYKAKDLITAITSKKGSRPFELRPGHVTEIYRFLRYNSVKRIKGTDLVGKHPKLKPRSKSFKNGC